jgi:hypothetical protein
MGLHPTVAFQEAIFGSVSSFKALENPYRVKEN